MGGMVNQVSPGVATREIDLTTIVPASVSTVGAFVGMFGWGPVMERTLISNENELVNRFGKPGDLTYTSFYTAASYLAYSGAMFVVRAVDEDEAANASAYEGATAPGVIYVPNDDAYEGYSDTDAKWMARYPGDAGNSLKISVCGSANAYARTLSGSLAATAGSATITGTTTQFLTEANVGDYIKLGTKRYQIKTIGGPTSLTLTRAFDQTSGSFTTVRREWEHKSSFQAAPGTNELHVAIIDEDGVFTAFPGTLLETYAFVSTTPGHKAEDGTLDYYVDKINRTSGFVRFGGDAPATGGGKAEVFSFTGGEDGFGSGINDNPIVSARQFGYDLFADPEVVDIALVMMGEASSTLASYVINNIAETRADCVVFVSPEQADVVANPNNEVDDSIEFRNELPSTSYAVLDSGWKLQYDKYNDLYRWIPLNGDVAGLCARTDKTNDPWFSPGGLNRGNVKNVVKLAYNPNKAQRDLLYSSGINPVVDFVGDGTVLFGDKTLLAKPSAFDRINVRRLFIILKKSLSKAAKYTLFEFNDEFTRAQFVAMVEPFLRDIQGRRGLTDFKVVCDDSNNTPYVIQNNAFVGDIFIKPNYSINFVTLNLFAVGSGTDFSEVVGKA